jgi:Fungal Zn(2)-Cys(6) binuclear cluster domain
MDRRICEVLAYIVKILKCDEKAPSCSRCTRLGLVCVGSGQRRYKFQEQQYFPAVRTKKTNFNHPRSTFLAPTNQKQFEINIATFVIRIPPSNKITVLTSRYVHVIRLSADLRYNLAWAYGLFMLDIPRRMNTNEALDSSIDALLCAHSCLCARQQASIEALSSYSRALVILRQCLNDPTKASTSETLCAVMLLLICQVSEHPQDRCYIKILNLVSLSEYQWGRRAQMVRPL